MALGARFNRHDMVAYARNAFISIRFGDVTEDFWKYIDEKYMLKCYIR